MQCDFTHSLKTARARPATPHAPGNASPTQPRRPTAAASYKGSGRTGVPRGGISSTSAGTSRPSCRDRSGRPERWRRTRRPHRHS